MQARHHFLPLLIALSSSKHRSANGHNHASIKTVPDDVSMEVAAEEGTLNSTMLYFRPGFGCGGSLAWLWVLHPDDAPLHSWHLSLAIRSLFCHHEQMPLQSHRRFDLSYALAH